MSKLLATDGEGERLDRYELIGEIASGGMATVFLARLAGVARFPAPRRDQAAAPAPREGARVRRDVPRRGAARRAHPPPERRAHPRGRGRASAATTSSWSTSRARRSRGCSRARRRRQARSRAAASVRIVLDVLAGLHAAHELTDERGAAARSSCIATCRRRTSSSASTASRASPTSASRARPRGSRRRAPASSRASSRTWRRSRRAATAIDRRADVFACGIVLWEVLALQRLFKGDGDAETLKRVLYEPIAPPSTRAPTSRRRSRTLHEGARPRRRQALRDGAGVRRGAREGGPRDRLRRIGSRRRRVSRSGCSEAISRSSVTRCGGGSREASRAAVRAARSRRCRTP